MRAREFKVFMKKAKYLSKNQINQIVNTLSPPVEDDTPVKKIEAPRRSIWNYPIPPSPFPARGVASRQEEAMQTQDR